MNILIVEDDPKIAGFIAKGLKESGYVTEVCGDGALGLDLLTSANTYDMAILDIMLPHLNGLQILEGVRKAHKTLPILVLSARRSVDEKVAGLQQGADDYLVKPFAFSELLARVQNLLKRSHPQKEIPTQLQHFGIVQDLLTRQVTRDGLTINLQAKEFSLLEYFMRNPCRVLSKTSILENVYGYNFDTQTNVIDVLVFRLRNKIDKDFSTKTIHTVRGIGYVFKTD